MEAKPDYDDSVNNEKSRVTGRKQIKLIRTKKVDLWNFDKLSAQHNNNNPQSDFNQRQQ